MSLRKLEDELIGEKHWTLRGEIRAAERPKNALLDEINIELPFANTREHDSALNEALGVSSDAEDIVEDRLAKIENRLESLIKRRICLKQFDNVDRLQLSNSNDSTHHPLNPFADEIDTSRAKKGLTEEYVSDSTANHVLTNHNKEIEDECVHLWTHLKARLTQLVDGVYIPPATIVRETEV